MLFAGGPGLVALDGGGPGADPVSWPIGPGGIARLRAGFYQLAVLALLGMVLNQTFGCATRPQTLGPPRSG